MRLSLLLPARKQLGSASVVARWLARGDHDSNAAPGRDATLRECFTVSAATLPTAALTRSLDAGDAADALWLRADPAFVMADAVTLRLLACGDLRLSADETEAIAQTLKPLFGDAGFAFDAPHPARWYLRCARGAPLPKFSVPEDALGDDLVRHLPEGEHARRWRGLLNEVQIVLTQHPVNARRAQRGMPPVNSLWFWGPGTLPQQVRSGFDGVTSDDAVVIALARLAKIPSVRLKPNSGSIGASVVEASRNDGKKNVLIDLADERDVHRLDTDWLAPIDDALKRARITRLDVRFESGERHVVKSVHRWRFWRRTKTIA